MQTEITKPKKWGWLVAVLVFVAACWLAANWEDFKEGYVAGFNGQAKPKP
jgi:hypothetical protein